MARVVALLLALSLLSACDTNKDPDVFRPTFTEVACPDDVEARVLSGHECGYLTVLENRSEPDGGTVRLFVLRTDPPESTGLASITLNPDIGQTFSGAGDSGAGAARVERSVYSLDQRGAGTSEPSLDCPEIETLAPDAAEALSDDADFRAAFLNAVGGCRDRLVSDGIDLASYDQAQTALDLEDLRMTLGLDHIATASQGTNARSTIEFLRRTEATVDWVYFDSPQFPEFPEPGTEALGVDAALAALDPALPEELDVAVERLDRSPLTFTASAGHVADVGGQPTTIRADGAKLVRAVRFVLGGDGAGNVSGLAEMIQEAARGRASGLFRGILADDTTLCAGYRPQCPLAGDFSWGVYLTTLCRDQAPFVDPANLAASVRGRAGFDIAYGDNPYLAACESWDVAAADDSVTEPLTDGPPVLLLPGELDSFSPLAFARQAAKDWGMAYVLPIPGQTHNVMGFGDCQVTIRNEWIKDPSKAPADTSCLAAVP